MLYVIAIIRNLYYLYIRSILKKQNHLNNPAKNIFMYII